MSSQSPLISICIPTYNRSQYLNKCIQSVIGYPDTDIEIVISDNASPDETEKVVKQFSDKRIRYYRNDENIGARRNVNRLLKYAKGEYIFCLTDDDMLIPGSIDIVKAFIKDNPVNAFKCDLINYNILSRSSDLYSYFDKFQVVKKDDYVSQALIYQSAHILSGCCYKRDLVPFDLLDKYIDLWYPSQFIMGMLNEKLGYISEPLIIHIWENELFWDNIKSDQLLNSQIDNLKIILEETGNRKFVEEIALNMATYILSHNGKAELSPQLLKYINKDNLNSWKNEQKKKNKKGILSKIKKLVK